MSPEDRRNIDKASSSETLDDELRDRIDGVLQKYSLPQAWLARLIGVAPKTFWAYLTRNTKSMRPDRMARLKNAVVQLEHTNVVAFDSRTPILQLPGDNKPETLESSASSDHLQSQELNDPVERAETLTTEARDNRRYRQQREFLVQELDTGRGDRAREDVDQMSDQAVLTLYGLILSDR